MARRRGFSSCTVPAWAPGTRRQVTCAVSSPSRRGTGRAQAGGAGMTVSTAGPHKREVTLHALFPEVTELVLPTQAALRKHAVLSTRGQSVECGLE